MLREAERARVKRGGVFVLVQGLPLGFGVSGTLSEVPREGTVPRSALFDALRSGSAANVREGAVPIVPVLVEGAYPQLGEERIDVQSGRQGLANLTFEVAATAATRGLFAYRREALTTLAAPIEASDDEYVVVPLRGDVRGALSVGDVVYCGRETLRVRIVAEVYDEEAGTTAVAFDRGQCGSERGALQVGFGVYQSPPYLAGRRVLLVRTLEGEEAPTALWRGALARVNPAMGGTLFRCEAEGFLAREVEHAIGLMGYERAWVTGIFTGVPGDVEASYFVYEGEASARADLRGAANLTGRDEMRYVQVEDEIVRLDEPLPHETGIPDGVAGLGLVMRVADRDRGQFGTSWTESTAWGDAVTGASDTRASRANAAEWLRRNASELSLHALMVVEGHPSRVALQLLRSGGGGDDGYDVYAYGAGAGVNDVDAAAFEQLVEEHRSFRCRVIGGLDGKVFLPVAAARKVLASMGAHLTTDALGRLRPALFGREAAPLLPTTASLNAGVLVMLAGDEVRWPDVGYPLEQTVTAVEIQTEGDPLDGYAPRVRDMVRGAELEVFHDGERVVALDATTLMTGGSTVTPTRAKLTARAFTWLSRYGRPVPRVSFTAGLDASTVSVGDALSVDFSGVPGLANPETGMSGFGEATVEVDGRSVDLARGIVVLTGALVEREAGSRVGLVAPSLLVTGVTGVGNGSVVSVAAHRFVPEGSDNVRGASDLAHFGAGDGVRFYVADEGRYRGAGAVARALGFTATSFVLSEVPEVLSGDPPEVGDVVEYATWDVSRESERQRHCVHLADDGATANVNEGDERLIGEEPFLLAAEMV